MFLKRVTLYNDIIFPVLAFHKPNKWTAGNNRVLVKMSCYSFQAAIRSLNSWEAKHSATPFSQNLAAFRLCRWDGWCTSAVFTGSRISTLTPICIHTPCANHSQFIVTSIYSNYSLYHLWLATSVIWVVSFCFPLSWAKNLLFSFAALG